MIPPRVDTISTWTYIHTAEAIWRAPRVRMLGLLLHFDKQWELRSLCRFKRLYLARFCIGSLIILGSWLVYRVQMSCYASHCNEEQVHPTFKISEAKFRQLIRCFCLDLNACQTSSLTHNNQENRKESSRNFRASAALCGSVPGWISRELSFRRAGVAREHTICALLCALLNIVFLD